MQQSGLETSTSLKVSTWRQGQELDQNVLQSSPLRAWIEPAIILWKTDTMKFSLKL